MLASGSEKNGWERCQQTSSSPTATNGRNSSKPLSRRHALQEPMIQIRAQALDCLATLRTQPAQPRHMKTGVARIKAPPLPQPVPSPRRKPQRAPEGRLCLKRRAAKATASSQTCQEECLSDLYLARMCPMTEAAPPQAGVTRACRPPRDAEEFGSRPWVVLLSVGEHCEHFCKRFRVKGVIFLFEGRRWYW